MDPNATLNEIRGILAMHEADGYDPDRMCDLVELVAALDGWISGGGFLPAAWNAKSTTDRSET
jgi:hypothetical protein